MASATSNLMYAQKSLIKEDNYVTVDHVKLHYRTGGSGPYLLLLHGFTLSSEQWTAFFDDFSKHYTIVALDLPGHGKSDRLGEPFSYEKWAELTLKFMKALNIQSAKGIGHSAGAITLLHMVDRQPGVLESIILIAGAHRYSVASRDLLIEDAFDKADQEWQEYYLKIHFNNMSKISALFDDIRSMADRVPTTTSEATLTPQKLSRMTLPVFMVWGDRDFYFPMDIATELYLTLPNAKLWVVPKQGHTPVWKFMGGDEQAAEAFPGLALEFLSTGFAQ